MKTPTTIEELREIGKEVQKIGNGTYLWPSMESEVIGDLTIIHIKHKDKK